MTAEDFANIALSLAGAIESAHFGKRDFRIGNKIFASLPAADRAVVNFTPAQQVMMVAASLLCLNRSPMPGAPWAGISPSAAPKTARTHR